MKSRLLLWLLLLLSGVNVYARYTSPYDFRDIKEKGEYPHVADTQNLLSQKEIYVLNEKLDSIKNKYIIDFTIVLISEIPSSHYDTSEKFAKDLHFGLRIGLLPEDPDYNIVVVYNQKNNDMGYYIGHSLRSYPIDALLIELQFSLINIKKIKRKKQTNIYPILSQFATNTEEQIGVYVNQIIDRFNQLVSKESNVVKKTSKDLDETLYVGVIKWSFIALGVWGLIIGIIGRIRCQYREDLHRFISLTWASTILFYLIAFPILIYFICKHLDTSLFQMTRTLITVIVFMVLGWLPTTILFRLAREFFGRNKPSIVVINTQQKTKNESSRQKLDVDRININKATSEELLRRFNNLYPEDTERIIKVRRSSGLFEDTEDLQRRTKLSELAISILRPYIYFFSDNEVIDQATVSEKTTTVDINTATLDQVKQLSGLLTSIDSMKIIRERDDNGYFKNYKDFKQRTNLSNILLDDIKQNLHFSASDNSEKNKDKKRVVDF